MANSSRILVIEDDIIFCNTIVDALRNEGLDVTAVHDGYQALENSKKNLYELIIADIRFVSPLRDKTNNQRTQY